MKIEIDVPVPEGWEYESNNLTLLGQNLQKLWIRGEFSFNRVEPVDHELEEAKRKFEGKWFKLNSMDMVQKARDVVRSGKGDILILCTNGQTEHVNTCTPFPIPVWRCCYSDKPKQDGCYHTRHKEDHGAKGVSMLRMGIWPFDFPYSEWLDEGGE